MKKKLVRISWVSLLSIISVVASSCKDDIDNLLDENTHELKLEWQGHYNYAKDRIFSGAFNSVKFDYNKVVDDSSYAVVIENNNVGQLSLEVLSIRLKSTGIGMYTIQDSSGSQIRHLKDFTKPAEVTRIKSGKITITESQGEDVLKGDFEGWGLSGADTMFITGNFLRKKL